MNHNVELKLVLINELNSLTKLNQKNESLCSIKINIDE